MLRIVCFVFSRLLIKIQNPRKARAQKMRIISAYSFELSFIMRCGECRSGLSNEYNVCLWIYEMVDTLFSRWIPSKT